MTAISDVTSLMTTCESLRQALLRLPRGVIQERLFILLTKALEDLRAKRFKFLQARLFTMAALTQEVPLLAPVLDLIEEAQNQLTTVVSTQKAEV